IPAVEVAVAELEPACTGHWHVVVQGRYTILEGVGRRRELPRGSWRIPRLDDLVVEGAPRVGVQHAPVFGGNASDKAVRGVGGGGIERQDFAGVWVERDRATPQRIAEQGCCEALEIEIDARIEWISRNGRDICTRACIADHTTARVDLDEPGSLAP